MKILLFGGSGVMGTALDRVCRTVGFECLQPSHAAIDVTDADAVAGAIDKFAPAVVMNAVALIGYDLCENDPVEAFRINSLPASHLAKACAAREITFVQFSTHAVFDGAKDGPYSEQDSPNPLNSYAATKYLAELFCRNLCPRHYVVRLPTLFGPRRNDRLGFADKVLERIGKGEPLRIAVDKIDSPTYSLDAASRIIAVLQESLPYGVYHLANHGSASYFEFVAKILQIKGAAAVLLAAKDSDFPFQGKKPLKTAMTSAKLHNLRPWEDALQAYLENEGGI
ncbi:NAD(P)-dependent oxidoreductase [Geobacter pelophilus]|uniref:dTDP-4-dehydrorhamnose reductase n=1 Tax=Geoanaerobacter pelophilus TaxID=60036 RepID=A0AAW4LAF7_9BACT|nr:NAD(P)-dependent oxidoreductase [Geoanaerobacter pelophilus]MBT0666522.1 NAD(P)-dependent oxidoreductase [Geoanaerobacter pelophilus]